MKIDEWVWGQELIISDKDKDFTIKVLIPKDGLSGSLSLQSHKLKLEYWLIISGKGVGQFILSNEIHTVFLKKGMVFRIFPGVIHRVASLNSLRILEISTLDEHSLDKSKPKDVLRYHCFHGRECNSSDIDPGLLQVAVKEFTYYLGAKKSPKQRFKLNRLSDLGIYSGELNF